MYEAPYGLTLQQKQVEPTFLLPVCTTPERLAQMISALTEGGMVYGWGQIGDYNVDVYEALAHINSIETTGCYNASMSEAQKQEIIRYVSAGFDSDCEEEKLMPCLEIVQFGGIAYLQQKCGCDETRLYQLSQVALDGNGVPISVQDGGGSSSGDWGFDGVSGDNADCYAQSATSYMLSRASDFATAIIDWTVLGADVFSGELDEMLETVRLIADLIFGTGDLTDIKQLTKSAVISALADNATVDPLEANWNFSGQVNRSELRGWVKSAPNLVGGVPVRMILNAWLDYSSVLFYNRKLSELAAACESGNSIPSTVVTIIFENASYQLVQISTNDQTFSIVGDILTVTDFQNVAAVLQTATLVSGTGFGNHMQIETNVGTDNLITGTYGGNTDNIGTSYPAVAGTSGAVEFGKSQLPAYSAVVPSPTPAGLPYSGVATVECVVQQSDWVTRLDELYLVIEK